jgi:hypothetical protein
VSRSPESEADAWRDRAPNDAVFDRKLRSSMRATLTNAIYES